MDAKTLTALQSSIAKWENIVNGIGVDRGASNCALCEAFSENYGPPGDGDDDYGDEGCIGCPVSAKTGRPDCMRTPYIKWVEYISDSGRSVHCNEGASVFDETSRGMAQAELDFLKSLLPVSHAVSAIAYPKE